MPLQFKPFFIFFSVLTFCFFSSTLFSYSLETYLNEVRNQNFGFKSSVTIQDANQLKSKEIELRFMPYLSSSLQGGIDKKKSNQSAFLGEEPSSILFNIGVDQQFRNGLQTRLGYKINYFSFKGANSLFVPESSYLEAIPALEFQYPLGRNFKGKETKATEKIAQKQYQVVSTIESYKQTLLLMEADMTYWRLFLAREIVRIQEKSLDQAYKLKEWVSKKQQLNLYDRSDLYQAEAAYKFHEIELLNAKNEEASARRAFNRIRGKEGELVEALSDDLKLYFEETRQHLFSDILPEKPDIHVLTLQQEIASLNALIVSEKNKPNITIGSSIALSNKDQSLLKALTPQFDYPTFGLAVTLQNTLASKHSKEIVKGYHQEALALEKNLAYQKFEEAKEFQELRERFGETLRKYELCLQLEEIQKNKYKNELSRQEKGRTTIYQVLMFEQDYLNAQLNRIRVTSELVGICAKTREFIGGIDE